jgi:hypothetical protein
MKEPVIERPERDNLYKLLKEEQDLLISLDDFEEIYGSSKEIEDRIRKCHKRIDDIVASISWLG